MVRSDRLVMAAVWASMFLGCTEIVVFVGFCMIDCTNDSERLSRFDVRSTPRISVGLYFKCYAFVRGS